MKKRAMETRELVERVNMVQIFWETQIDTVMKLKPTSILDEKDVLSLKDMTSNSSQAVGVQSMDAAEIWRSWVTQYAGLMKLREREVETALGSMLLDNIHGMTEPLETEPDEERRTLQSDETAPGPDAQ